MQSLAIDIETFSSRSLLDCGVYRYAESEDFEILLFAYSFDGDEVKVIDLASGERLPAKVISALINPQIVKRAYNAQFERVCLGKYFDRPLDPSQWQCTMAYAAMLGLPGSLDMVSKVLKLSQQKMSEGKALIRYFCQPCKATKTNGGRTRNLPTHDPAKWELFKAYNAQDVRTEMEIFDYCLRRIPFPERERQIYTFDQNLNDYGVLVDQPLVKAIVDYDRSYQEALRDRAGQLTGLLNPNSVSQLKEWLSSHGIEVGSLNKDSVNMLLEDHFIPSDVKELLKLRQETSKTSVKKYQAMLDTVCSDGRIHGVLQYYGAGRTGRWAGRLVQVQNLPRNSYKALDGIRLMTRRGEFDDLSLLYDSLSNIFSQLVRTAFVAPEGKTYCIADYSAIEARVIAWLAGEVWKMDLFAQGGKLYETTAAKMFNVPVESITHDSPLRAKGKVAELACGYGGSVGALTAMGALEMGLSSEELLPIVYSWRKANPKIVKLWDDVDQRVRYVIEGRTKVNLHHGVSFKCDGEYLWIYLPTGRALAYYKPYIDESGRIKYQGLQQTNKIWGEIDTFGGKLVENVVQAIARDCLAEAMLQLHQQNYKIVFHVHDEVIVESSQDQLDKIKNIMGQPLAWAPGLLLKAEGYCSDYYRKD